MTVPEYPILSVIFSEDFYLSRYSRDDNPEVVKNLNNPHISDMLRLPPFPYTPEDAAEWHKFIETEKQNDPDTARFRWNIRQVSTNKMVGDISLVEVHNVGYRLGYWLAEQYWGKGLMSNAVAEALKNVRREEGVKVFADVKEGNWGSRKVLEKNGFKYCGEHYDDGEKCIFWDLEIDLREEE